MSEDVRKSTIPRGKRLQFSLCVSMLILASMTSQVELPLFGYTVRLEHYVVLLVGLLFPLYRLWHRRKPFRVPLAGWFLGGWILVGFVASLQNSPLPEESLRHVLRFVLLLIAFLIVHTVLSEDVQTWKSMFYLWCLVAGLEAFLGSIAWLLSLQVGQELPGVRVFPSKPVPAATGTVYEPNIFGGMAAAFLVMNFFICLVRGRIIAKGGGCTSSIRTWILLPLFALAVVASQTRAAWVAAVLGLVVAYPFSSARARTLLPRMILVAIALPFLSMLILLFIFWLGEKFPFLSLARTFLELGHGSTWMIRVNNAKLAFTDWLVHPFIGNGYNSFGLIHGYLWGSWAWVSNLVLHLLVDTGVVGTVLFLVPAILLGIKAFKAWPDQIFVEESALLRAVALGFFVILFTYQATEATWLLQYWIHLAFLSSGLQAIKSTSGTLCKVDRGAIRRESHSSR